MKEKQEEIKNQRGGNKTKMVRVTGAYFGVIAGAGKSVFGLGGGGGFGFLT
jgi:hypothetical protein